MKITHDELTKIIEYNPITGNINWKVNLNKIKSGDLAGSDHEGYRIISIYKKRYLVHNLVWFYHYKIWPSSKLTHLDGNTKNNSISNLQLFKLKPKFILTHSELLRILSYDPLTGIFVWKDQLTPKSRVKINSTAGTKVGGYLKVKISCKGYLLHRLAWFYVHGTMVDLIDHKDGNTLNNKINNLRIATKSQNSMNRKVLSNSTTGFKGVYKVKDSNKYYSKIKFNGNQIYLGAFKTAEEAALTYNKKAIELFGEFAWINVIDIQN